MIGDLVLTETVCGKVKRTYTTRSITEGKFATVHSGDGLKARNVSLLIFIRWQIYLNDLLVDNLH